MSERDQKFEFHQQWVNKASSWLTSRGPNVRPICFDTVGNVCSTGTDFRNAKDNDTFPIRWVWPDQVAEHFAKMHRQAAAHAAVPHTVMTAEGKLFDFLAPERGAITVEAIAHGLSHICRFTGHCREFYSVAQHSVLVSLLVPEQHALAGLLHDAAEAFIGDVSSPLKALLPDYRLIERGVEAAVLGRFGLPFVLPQEVKHADLVMLATEQRDLMPAESGSHFSYPAGIEPMPIRLVPLPPSEAKRLFLARFQEITRAREVAA